MLGREVLRPGDHVRAVVVGPVKIKDAVLAQQAVPLDRAGIGGENEELSGMDIRGRKQVEDPVRDLRVIPIASERAGGEEANAAVLNGLDEINQHLPLAWFSFERLDGKRVHVERAVEVSHARSSRQIQKLPVRVEGHGG